jgi:ribonucleoside-diphosphate reductase alpha chain
LSKISPFSTEFAHSVYAGKYARPGERWEDTAERVSTNVLEALPYSRKAKTTGDAMQEHIVTPIFSLINDRKFIPGGRYLCNAGNAYHQTQNCLLLRAEDTREGWGELAYKVEMASLTGAGIGVYYGDLREWGARIRRTGGVASGPIPKAIAVNEQGRAAVSGGHRRGALWGGLLWSHPDCEKWIRAKDWPQWLREAKENAKDPNDVPAPLDMTNISVCLDDEFFEAYDDGSHPKHELAHRIYHKTVDKMLTTGEPGFSIDLGEQSDEKLRNACTEIVSADDSDVCNLGGVVLSRFDDPKEFGEAVRNGTIFLTAGTFYSDLPYEKVAEVREKNRRLGLDILGVHEFLLQRGLKYGSDDALDALEPFMQEYDRALEYANDFQNSLGCSLSVAATSGAPTGTRGIIAETTTSWEPVTAAAYKRVVIYSDTNNGDRREVHYVVDPTVKRLVEQGVLAPEAKVEDSYSLAYDVERRFKMQAYAQSHTDQGISMTINLPSVIRDEREQKDFAHLLYKYLPKFRGITCYPNNARAGQPITPVPLEEALNHEGLHVEEDEDKCASGVCGI